MKLAQILEASYNEHPAIRFIKSVDVDTDDYIEFPYAEMPQVAEVITKTFGPPIHEPRRTKFGGHYFREWYWDVAEDEDGNYINVFLSVRKNPKGKKPPLVARLGVEHYSPDYDEGINEAVAGEHPIFQEIQDTLNRGYRDVDVNAEDVPHIVRALTAKMGKPRITYPDPSEYGMFGGDTDKVTNWTWGDHAHEGSEVEIELYHDGEDNAAWLEISAWPEMHPGGAEGINEAKYYRDHPVVEWIKDVMEFLRVNQLLTVHVKDADEAIKAVGFEYGPPLAIGSDYSEWNIETDVHGGRLYHLEVRDKARGGSVNLTRVI